MELAEEGRQLCEDSGYHFFTWYFWYSRAIIAAARGGDDTVNLLSDRITRSATPRGVGAARHYCPHVRTVADLGRGGFESAYQHATSISPAGTFASHVPHALWVAMDLVEAAVRTNRDAEATAHVRAMQEVGIAGLSPRVALLAGGSEALCAAKDEDAARLFGTALAVPGIERRPFDLARVRLAYGERLRRARANTESRGPLTLAYDTFNLLGARPWTEGGRRNRVPPDGSRREPARTRRCPRRKNDLAASGLSNKQIAERLYLSHRTVGAYLYQIFPKLGVSSPAALRDALAVLESHAAVRPGEFSVAAAKPCTADRDVRPPPRPSPAAVPRPHADPRRVEPKSGPRSTAKIIRHHSAV